MNKLKKVLVLVLILFVGLIFIDNISAETYNNYSSVVVSCGDGYMTNIPKLVPRVISLIYTIIQIAVPVVLVIMGSLDLMKGISAQKEEDIKKGQQIFIKRLIAAVLVFFVFVIVKVVIGVAADGTKNEILDCTECFISNECDSIFDGIKDAIENIKDNIENIYDKETKK